ncbi:GNAT family N-acetyltransferase [Arthrobacter gengyunqii]|uniref:GNAT family N-acetyltransferase n=1 Tax=Arthrobacter gengyunqii TaxID=2886940 RepID=A0A9X1M067_9MICC|nr:GNAT family N-acetyltransferase [Arthrobacter gengyunqii]MCC3268327.1 GNAT family N-acetyltransferase [Arthrobacter gengyunqii]UOY95729.1 GNAT family N-acetyltransferase [Arthrobacter gengyunqii]
MQGSTHRAGASRLLVGAVRVDAGLRGNGLGSAMMAWAVEEGRRRGASMVQLTSDRARDSAHRFYERLGFTPSHVGFKLFL